MPDRARVLVVIKGLGLGGAERLIADAAPVWDRDAFDYTVAYVLPWKDHLVAPIRSTGVEVECVGGRRGLDLRTPARLRHLIDRLGANLVHAHLPSAGILARLSTTTPIVYTEHNIAGSYRLPTRLLNRFTYWRNREVIAVSAPVAESLASYPGPEPKVIPNGITVEPSPEVGAVRAELGIGAQTPLLVHVGNIRPHKGHSNLIQATALLARTVPDAQVVSIGAEKNDGDLERVRNEARAAGAERNMRFLGRRDDARLYLQAADVVVNPSDYEGLPVALLEALALGRPVVATDVGGVSQIVRHEDTGLLVPSGDPAALASALERALTTDGGWGERGRRLVLEHHGMASMVTSYEGVYRSVLGI
jgi:glycosyltransferase involved in cell wall biosynthesis